MIGLLLAGVFLIVAGAYAKTAPKIIEKLVYEALTEAEFTRVVTGPWGMGHDAETGNARRVLTPNSERKLKKIQIVLLIAGLFCLGFAFSVDEVRNPRALSTTITLFAILMAAPPYFYWRATVKRGSERRLINIMEVMQWRRLPYIIGQFFLTIFHAVLMIIAANFIWMGLFTGFSLIL